MNRAEVIDLLIILKENYPTFDASAESVDRHFKYLQDFPYERALQNVDEHIRTSKFPPNIAEIRGSVGEQMERSRMKTATEEYFEERARAKLEACPPPPGWKEAIYAKLGRC
ncbi:replicative helicase loader/inhibitor [Paenibacillus sp. VMFN-D1]|uniref:replicative helicase loader/inhibitor n=1 Tax=Paenibacillus sp. VMFN-D1 TaxID=2135608 RepID=UPI000E39A658|nr:replicative helicase loader/inhibitor [Paenibacillus sp. VMFN-D1]RED34697.1 loader and inhibitor of G40P protein [Paenibacillus sp. VMFN-D1]